MTVYTSQTISGYNSSPPSDDGSQTASNEITWSKHKTKLADPIKTLAEAMNTAIVGSTPNTDGTAEASKYVTTDANKDITGLRHVTGTGTATFAAFAGPLTGNVTGNLTGNVTGNVTGDLTGDVTGTASGNALLAGSASQTFAAANGTTGNNVVTWAQFAQSLGSAGYVTFPGGFKINWGVQSSISAAGTSAVTFSSAFSTACVAMFADANTASHGNSNTNAYSWSTSGATVYNGESATADIYWLAIGY